ncbi:N-methyl-L-tryptophan oxidase [Actinoallomurus sp. NBC_01490]|jgi:sarcosine oxidase|uniref:N-methyl-L-tryptophan oxidase n=1 Tax=Actinoallomurus sp. NBC_01490 TaxID=2903557 RepID=UPI002E32DE9C|nr:N-methyl-L-tryptophan oxidase [Actinoallomurus sp. NBC_01490]
METLRKDVVVVGLGAFGSAALWRLAYRGVDVAGVERQAIGHHLGSSHGQTRLFRVACQEHPGLPPIALKTLELWTSLGEQIGETLVRQTGCLSTGAPDSGPVRGSLEAAAAAGVPVSSLSHEELVARQPQYAGLAPGDVAVWDPGAGVCYPERSVRAHVAAARRLGADVYPHTMVTGIEADDDGVTVRTPTVAFRAAQVVVAAGAWLGTLVPGLPLRPRRTPLYWFAPRDPASQDFTLARFPAFIWRRENGDGLWGHGSDEDFGVKVGLDRDEPHEVVDPEELDRYIHPARDLDELSAAVATAFPGLDPRPAKVIPCMVTDSADGQFVVGRPPGRSRLVVAGGDSGHGFKHAAGVGELLAQLVTGEDPYCAVDFLDPARFAAEP